MSYAKYADMRKSKVLRSPVHMKDFRSLGFAKLMCENFPFCEDFCESTRRNKIALNADA